MRNSFETTMMLGAMVAALACAPGAAGKPQAASQSSMQAGQQGQGAASPQAASEPKANAQGAAESKAAGNEPKMESQEAPPAMSLGEAARRAKAQKTQASTAAGSGPKVYTEDKLAGLSGHGVSVVGDESQGGDSSGGNSYAEQAAGSGSGNGGSGGKSDEQVWRRKAQTIHDQMAQIDDRIAKIQEEIQKYGAVSFDPSSGLQQNVIYIKDRNAQIQQLEEQKRRLQSQLDSLEDEGRKAGADPGWFR